MNSVNTCSLKNTESHLSAISRQYCRLSIYRDTTLHDTIHNTLNAKVKLQSDKELKNRTQTADMYCWKSRQKNIMNDYYLLVLKTLYQSCT